MSPQTINNNTHTYEQLCTFDTHQLSFIMRQMRLPTSGITRACQKIAAILAGEVTQEIKDMKKKAKPAPKQAREPRPMRLLVDFANPSENMMVKGDYYRKDDGESFVIEVDQGMGAGQMQDLGVAQSQTQEDNHENVTITRMSRVDSAIGANAFLDPRATGTCHEQGPATFEGLSASTMVQQPLPSGPYPDFATTDPENWLTSALGFEEQQAAVPNESLLLPGEDDLQGEADGQPLSQGELSEMPDDWSMPLPPGLVEDFWSKTDDVNL
ncbi:hypothetical protein K491DRAFT_693179 [Lophiostoma macrostomum CBS 122681]|uniref:Uncharacterized protein n=1 Tax=Lophiostoma macrostomum CBS 122681 TaxID=1314788 RepID=A0A6A6T532_9PLEO|nr:hypothetical protein K491DRAFT_693179 [Lophiostoma macrostomum CBS 122681]